MAKNFEFPNQPMAKSFTAATEVTLLYGWSIAESTGSAKAKVRIKDGVVNGVGGKQFATITLAENESVRDFFSVEAVKVTTGTIWVEVLSGSVEGSIYAE